MNTIKNFFIFCSVILIVILSVILLRFQKDKSEEPSMLYHLPFFLEIQVADDIIFDHENQFGFPISFMINQRSDFIRTSIDYRVENIEVGETNLSIPISTANIKSGEIIELKIHQFTQEMIISDDTNRFQENEWVSDDGWLIDETVFFITLELMEENETGRFKITKTRYENGNHIQVDEIRFINHYLGNN